MLIASVKGVRINSNGKIPGSPAAAGQLAGQGKTLKSCWIFWLNKV